MKHIINRIKRRFSKKTPQSNRKPSPIHETGFHGDRYLLNLVDSLLAEVVTFIETGTNVGTTAHYIATHHPDIYIHSCEPDKKTYEIAQKTTELDTSVQLYNQLSPDFLYSLHAQHPELLKTLNLYWLDAHGYGYQWPLHDEIRHITSTLPRAIILIDDVQVPDHEALFKYCAYDGQECDWDYITNALTANQTYRIFYPAYTEHTSAHHPLIGTMGILHGDIALDDTIFEHFKVVEVER